MWVLVFGFFQIFSEERMVSTGWEGQEGKMEGLWKVKEGGIFSNHNVVSPNEVTSTFPSLKS